MQGCKLAQGRLVTTVQQCYARILRKGWQCRSAMGANMNIHKPFVSHALRAIPVGLLALVVVSGAHAQSADPTEQLEKEIRDIKLRLSNLEAAQGNPATSAEPVQSGGGWKAVANWRALKSGMSPSDVRGLLGEPARLDGGYVARWYYPSGGQVIFISDRVTSWTEPR